MPEQHNYDTKSLIDLTSRIDERVKQSCISQEAFQTEVKETLSKMSENMGKINSRVAILETFDMTRVDRLENIIHALDTRVIVLEHGSAVKKAQWQSILNSIFQLIVALLVGIILFKLGIK